jgi:hypothetical protein
MNMFRSNFDENYSNANSANSNVDLLTEDYSNFNNEVDLRTYNSLKLRQPSKSAIKYFNAIQQVFNSKFSDGR